LIIFPSCQHAGAMSIVWNISIKVMLFLKEFDTGISIKDNSPRVAAVGLFGRFSCKALIIKA
ncbi:MAG: hypothetical protein WCF02_07765, partial [Azonexus sp.]